MPEPIQDDTRASSAPLHADLTFPLGGTCSESEDMDSELRIVDAPSSDTRSPGQMEAEESSTDTDCAPQDLRVLRASPPPITLAAPKAAPSPLRPPDPPASRKRKSTTPTQDRRAKWSLGNGSPLRPPPPLSPAINGRGQCGAEEVDSGFMQHGLLGHMAPGSGGATPLLSPAAAAAEGPSEDEEVVALRQDIGRFEEQLRSDLSAASDRFCQCVEASVRQAMSAVQARHLSALSASSQVALPPLADINGNPALLNMKEVSKNVEQFMLASQCLPYRFIAAAAAAANSGRVAHPQLPYTPISGPAPGLISPLLPPPGPPMPLPFPLATPGSCDSPSGTAADSDEPDMEGLPLNMSKKKRTKVTDNHLRAFAGLDVAAVLPAALENLGVFNNMAAVTAAVSTSLPPPPLVSTPSLASTPLRGPSASFADLSSTTLTPVHLRKAKLMFFFTRYPNSNVLKVYFPDVQFNKHNTAQIVKWFSNFREFYYIQIEKFARQAIAEGVQEAEEISIMAECELVRNLNTHYNRNNQIPVPQHFITVVEVTVREFFKALICHKDQDHSWKKPIYKVIARYDQPVPDDFKTSTWIDHMDT